MELKQLFDLVTKENASDLLISAGAPPVLRKNGKLFRTRGDSLTSGTNEEDDLRGADCGAEEAL